MPLPNSHTPLEVLLAELRATDAPHEEVRIPPGPERSTPEPDPVQLLRGRRSHRAFADDSVSEEAIRHVGAAAATAIADFSHADPTLVTVCVIARRVVSLPPETTWTVAPEAVRSTELSAAPDAPSVDELVREQPGLAKAPGLIVLAGSTSSWGHYPALRYRRMLVVAGAAMMSGWLEALRLGLTGGPCAGLDPSWLARRYPVAADMNLRGLVLLSIGYPPPTR